MSVTIKQKGVESVLIVGADSGIIGRKLGIALAHALVGDMGLPVPRLPTPKPAKPQTATDLERIEAAEAKRQRRIQRNQQRSN